MNSVISLNGISGNVNNDNPSSTTNQHALIVTGLNANKIVMHNAVVTLWVYVHLVLNLILDHWQGMRRGLIGHAAKQSWRNSRWRHQKETFSALLALYAVNSPLTADKGQWRGALMFPLICSWTRGWVNNRDAVDLRRHRARHKVTEIMTFSVQFFGTGLFTTMCGICRLNVNKIA